MKISYKNITPYKTKDGSTIRELMHPSFEKRISQSLAEAKIPVNKTTFRHHHVLSHEIYHVTKGKGQMSLGSDSFEVASGDTVYIPPGTDHCIKNIGNTSLVILCCCSPAYSHEDTVLSL